jgi:hypothetical protein
MIRPKSITKDDSCANIESCTSMSSDESMTDKAGPAAGASLENIDCQVIYGQSRPETHMSVEPPILKLEVTS